MNSLISPDNILVLWAMLFLITVFSLWAENKKYGKLMGGAVIAIVLGFILGNVKIMPSQSPLYSTVDQYILPLAIPLLLFRANVNKIAREAGATLKAFLVGAFATVVGALVAYSVIDLPDFQGPFTGVMSSTYIGGGMNFVAVSNAFGIPEGDLLTAAYAADNIITILFLIFLGAIPSIRFFAKRFPAGMEAGEVPEKKKESDQSRLANYTTIVIALFIAFLLVYAGNLTQSHLEKNGLHWDGMGLLTTTLLALLYATYAPEMMAKMRGAFDMGMVLMMVFFASLGARADLVGTLGSALPFFGFAIIIVSVHAVILFGVGKFMKLTLPELITASNACILGPATAAGLAGTKGWHSLVTPGLLVGILGYALANFIGVALGNWLG